MLNKQKVLILDVLDTITSERVSVNPIGAAHFGMPEGLVQALAFAGVFIGNEDYEEDDDEQFDDEEDYRYSRNPFFGRPW